MEATGAPGLDRGDPPAFFRWIRVLTDSGPRNVHGHLAGPGLIWWPGLIW